MADEQEGDTTSACSVQETVSTNQQHESDADGRDKGWAWVVLVADFMVHFLNLGLLSSLGVYLVEWERQLDASVTQLSWVVSLIIGMTLIVGSLGNALCKVFSVRQVVIAGSVVTTLSFIAASFSSELWHLYLTFAIAGVGMGLIFQPSFIINVYYFDKLLGRANGASLTGTAIGIFALPPLFQLWIDTYGWQGSLLLVAAFVAHISVCGALFRSTPLERENRKSAGESDNSEGSNQPKSTRKTLILSVLKVFDVKLLRYVYFVILLLAYFLMAISYNITLTYLPSRAISSGIPELEAASLVSALGIGALVARLTHGFVIDYHLLSTSSLTALGFFACGLSCSLIPVAQDYWSLATLAVIAGVASGTFLSTVAILVTEYVGVENVSGGMGLVNTVQGVSVTIGLYLAGVLVDTTGSYDVAYYLAGAIFFCCSGLLVIHPIRQYLHSRQQGNIRTGASKSDLHGIDNAAVDT